jgi:hypothetical protein
VAAVLATGSAVGVASRSGYNAAAKYVAAESLLVLLIVVVAILGARWVAVRGRRRRRFTVETA